MIRHGYVPPAWQRQGVGSALLAHLEDQARTARIVIGTYAANYKARAVLEKQGYRLSKSSEAVLREYFAIPEDRLKASVTYEKAKASCWTAEARRRREKPQRKTEMEWAGQHFRITYQ